MLLNLHLHKTLGNVFKCILGWVLMQNEGLACLPRYTPRRALMCSRFVIKSLWITIRSKFQEKISMDFIYRGSPHPRGLPGFQPTTLVGMTSFPKVPRVEDFPYNKNYTKIAYTYHHWGCSIWKFSISIAKARDDCMSLLLLRELVTQQGRWISFLSTVPSCFLLLRKGERSPQHPHLTIIF